MDEMTYEQRINMIAEEMAREAFKAKTLTWSFDEELDEAFKIRYVKSFEILARIAVAKMAEAATEFRVTLSEYGVQKRLAEYGLIPESEKPA